MGIDLVGAGGKIGDHLGQSTYWMQTFPKELVYFMWYGSPSVVEPAFLVSTKNKIVFLLYLYPSATNGTSSFVVPSSAMKTPPGASFTDSSINSLG